jgi:hypothetical protein
VVDAVEPQIREMLREQPTMSATVIAERIGWDRSLPVLKDRVRELGPHYLPADPAPRTSYDAGQRAHCDLWFPARTGPARSGPGRLAAGAGDDVGLLPDAVRDDDPVSAGAGPDLRALAVLQRMGAVPKQLVWDNEAAVRSWRGRQLALLKVRHSAAGGATSIVLPPRSKHTRPFAAQHLARSDSRRVRIRAWPRRNWCEGSRIPQLWTS